MIMKNTCFSKLLNGYLLKFESNPILIEKRVTGFDIDVYTRTFTNEHGKSIYLTSKEFDLLYFLFCHKGQVFTKDQLGMATVFLTNFIRCRTSFRMLFRLSLTMSLLGCDDLRQELTVKVRLPR
ncbi:winged helix-turn-helix domain-containing protein [Enterococcus cecorum]|uniref:winged helix-turn-helix domain-containing protein n=1 Tax=Enterococcus cecorum TaxID=44008 RepID=UPI0038B25A73